jgi:hypothetical protein
MSSRRAGRSLVAIVLILGLASFALLMGTRSAVNTADAGHAGGADAFAVDMDPLASPGNTATSLGSREECRRIDQNGVIDADESSIDTLAFDVTAVNIPQATPLALGFAHAIGYSEANLTIKSQSHLLIASSPGSSVFNASEPTPDTNGNDVWEASVADTGSMPGAAEHGSGVLSRLEIGADVGAAMNVYPLTLLYGGHIDQNNITYAPDALINGNLAVNRSCPLPPVDIEMVALSLTSVSPLPISVSQNFDLVVEATARNNGPSPADIAISAGIAGPSDCTLTAPANQTEGFLNVPAGETRTTTQLWTANCSTPSSHQFVASASVAVTGLAEETNPLNNGPIQASQLVAVQAQADPAVTGVTANSPADAATGEPFTVTVSGTVHNLSGFTPVNVDTVFNLAVPAECSRTPDSAQTVQDTALTVSTSVVLGQSWTVSCTTVGIKTFNASVTVGIDQLHVTDIDGANNTGQAQTSTDTSLGVADLKVTSVTVTTPASAPVTQSFGATVKTTVHNNGPFAPVNADIEIKLNLPPDCFTPVTKVLMQDAKLGPSINATLPDITFHVACVDHSFHGITAAATIIMDDPLAGDPNPGNNALTSPSASVAIIRTSEFKLVSAALSGPAAATVAAPFQLSIDPVVHNNGPHSGPVIVTTTLLLPGDCATPVNPLVNTFTLPVSAGTALPAQVFPVTCLTESTHSFEALVQLGAELHVEDPNSGNNSASTTTLFIPLLAEADLGVASVIVSGPAQAAINTPFTVTATANVANNGPFSPVNGDATVTLHLPGDCSTADANPRTFTGLSFTAPGPLAVGASWSVTCASQSSHAFGADAAVTLNHVHVSDPVSANNAAGASPLSIPVFAQADGRITNITAVDPPAFLASNTATPVTIRTTLHNDGPFASAGFTLTGSITPPAGCTVTPPAPSLHTLNMSTSVTVDAAWTVNCAPGTYTLTFVNTVTPATLHVSDPAATNNTLQTSILIFVDTDGDGIPDDTETACGSNPNNSASIPEMVTGPFAGADDDGDGQIDEPLPAGAAGHDCDGDGFIGSGENHVYAPDTRGDQAPCGTNSSPPTDPPSPIGWPADLMGGGIPDSTHRLTLLDLTSFLGPTRYFNTNLGTHPGDRRHDLTPGKGIFPYDINLSDLTVLLGLHPRMLGGVRAFNGPLCPWP